MHKILNLSLDAYEEIFQEIDTNGLVEKRGIIYVWTNKNLKSRNLEIKVRDELGIKQKLLDEDGFIKMNVLEELVEIYVNTHIKSKFGEDFSLEFMDDTMDICWDIKVKSIKQKYKV